MLDPHRLRQFVAVAKHLNITHAAAELKLTQQAVSSTIKTIERDLGVALLKRIGRRIELTDAGRTLRDGAQLLLDESSALVRAVRDAEPDRDEQLLVAHTSTVSVDEVVELVEPVCREIPLASVTVRQLLAHELIPALREGQADIALRRGVVVPDGFTGSIIGYSLLRVAVSTQHPLAVERTIKLGDLAGSALILANPPGDSFYSDFLITACRREGFEPSVLISRVQGMPTTTAVVGTTGFAFVTAEPGLYHHDEATVVEVAGAPRVPLQAIWMQHRGSRLRQILLVNTTRQR
jgi:DNA-binding transcriptional LysR family regulator